MRNMDDFLDFFSILMIPLRQKNENLIFTSNILKLAKTDQYQ